MRKILSKKDYEKKTKRNNLIIGIFLGVTMLISLLGYSLMSNENESTEKIEYKGKLFTNSNGLWQTNIGGFIFSFIYSPKESFIFNSEINYLNKYANLPLYVYLENLENSESYEAFNEIYRNLFYTNKIVQRIQYACLEGEKCEEDVPIKNCSENMIIIKESNTSHLYQKDNCVFIEGKKEDLVKITDSFLLKIIDL